TGRAPVDHPLRPPMFEGVDALAVDCLPGGGHTNQAHFEPGVRGSLDLEPWRRALIFDPQTSGGLLAALAEDEADAMLTSLRDAGVPAVRIGRVGSPRHDHAAIAPHRVGRA